MSLKKSYQGALLFAGFGMIAGAVFHIACLMGGPQWVEFAGAPEWAVESVREGTAIGYGVTLLIVFLLVFGHYTLFLLQIGCQNCPFLKPYSR